MPEGRSNSVRSGDWDDTRLEITEVNYSAKPGGSGRGRPAAPRRGASHRRATRDPEARCRTGPCTWYRSYRCRRSGPPRTGRRRTLAGTLCARSRRPACRRHTHCRWCIHSGRRSPRRNWCRRSCGRNRNSDRCCSGSAQCPAPCRRGAALAACRSRPHDRGISSCRAAAVRCLSNTGSRGDTAGRLSDSSPPRRPGQVKRYRRASWRVRSGSRA